MMISNFQFLPPVDWQSFERLSHWLWMDILKNPNAEMNGRHGQPQAGIDVYGQEQSTGKMYGIQCKGKDVAFGKKVTEKQLRAEIKKAKTFVPALDVFILATTAPNDEAIQRVARIISQEHEASGLFKVSVYGWDTIKSHIPHSERVIREIYPEYLNREQEIIDKLDDVLEIVTERLPIALKDTENDKSIFTSYSSAATAFQAASDNLMRWPRTLQVSDQWIERKEQEDIFIKFDSNNSSTTIILGDPGTGKSALLSNISHELFNSNALALAIKADYLDNDITDFPSLGKSLQLPGPIDKCILDASKFGPVYLVVDQLDTLSGLIDVKTQRLSVLLNLIKQLSGRPNIHILASSRPLEFAWDSRLNSIKADRLTLPDLDWEVVDAILISNGIVLYKADASYKAFLCRPNNLNFYLTYLTKNPERAFESHIELYDEIWRNSLGNGDAKSVRSKLLTEISTIMTNDAKQSLPLIRFEELVNEIDWLCTARFLAKVNNNRSIAFTHQTLQAYVWTRSFVKSTNSIIDFILTHQNNLNIRPNLTSVLFYLRDADPDEYNKQIQEILVYQRSIVRRHVVHLVIECVGATADPNEHEVAVFQRLMSDAILRARLINSISGKVKWFDKFSKAYLPALMTGSESEKYIAATLLSSVFEQRNEIVVALVEKYWFNETNVNFIFYLLRGLTTWDDNALKFAKYLATSKDAHQNTAPFLFHIIIQHSASAAIKFAATYLKNQLEKLDDLYQVLFPETETEIDYNWDSDQYRYIRQFEELGDVGSDWYNLPEIAGKEPKLFLEEFWDFFIRICNRTERAWYGERLSYIDTGGHWFHLSDEGQDHGDRYFSSALESSVVSVAASDPDVFVNLFKENELNESLLVQRVLAKGLVALASENSSFVLEQLLKEPRRFMLGHMNDRYSGTKEIIGGIASFLSPDDLAKLEKKIFAYQARKFSDDRDAEGKKWDMNYNRRVVYALLSAVPEGLRSSKAKGLMQMEERAFGTKIKKGTEIGGYSGLLRQVSPMSEAQMVSARDEDIVKCFQSFPDGKETDWRTDSTGVYVGSMEFAREFELFANNHPDRAAKIIQHLDEKNIQAISSGITGIAKSSVTLARLLEIIEPLEEKFAIKYFYEEVVRAIREKLSSDSTGFLQDDWCLKLESWLPKLITQRDTDKDEEEKSNPKKRQESIIWTRDHTIFFPNGSFSILDLLTIVYLNRQPPDVSKWLSMVRRHLVLNEIPSVWYTYLVLRLPGAISWCAAAEVEDIIDEILTRYPGALQRRELAITLVRAVHKVTDKKFYEWLELLKQNGSSTSLQMYGELIVAKALIHKYDKVAVSTIDGLIASADAPSSILTGIAFACRYEWRNFKEVLTPYIIRLLACRDQETSSITLQILNKYEDVVVDQFFMAILDAIIENETLTWVNERVFFLPKLLNRLAYIEQERVIVLCNHLIAFTGSDFGNITTAAAGESPDLISTAITLHNSGPEYQARGLDIFERLIELDAYQIRDALQKIDGTPRIKIT